ncbi:MAG: glutathione S-transferase family protein [Coleofasciculaceae cyanobacterium]
MATGMLIDGQWTLEEYQQDNQGRFMRNPTKFRNWVSADGSTGFKAESGRYHLYVSYACPWAHRTLLMRKLKGLEEAISLSIVDPFMDEDGWEFSEAPGCIPDTINGSRYLREVYIKAEPKCTGRVTVPILWDKETGTIVNNESREIIRMFDTEFEAISQASVSFYLEYLQAEIEDTINAIYNPINNGVYRSGFATTQNAYKEAVMELFYALNYWESILGEQHYLCGDQITEADWCMFTTLLRFDPVYYVHFKCNLSRIVDYPNLWNYLKDLYQQPGVKETCNFDHIKQHYYKSHPFINPTRIVPEGPLINFDESHNRNSFSDD